MNEQQRVNVHERGRPDRVVIFGGSGFLGRSLARHLTGRGYEVIVVSRGRPSMDGVRWAVWDGRTLGPWVGRLEQAAAVVNLVGRTVDCRKTPDHRDEILRSRLESTIAIGRALGRCEHPPGVWVQAGSTHLYGDPPETVCDEQAFAGEGLAPHVCTRWEGAFHQTRPAAVRGVILRMSFVLGRGGGPLRRLATLTRWGLGGRVASGRQWISWAHQADVNRAFTWAIERKAMEGPYNLTSPNPVRNAAFMGALRRAVGRPWSPPVPEPIVRLGARLVMNTDPELALYGRRCVPRRLSALGFDFTFADLPEALADILGTKHGGAKPAGDHREAGEPGENTPHLERR